MQNSVTHEGTRVRELLIYLFVDVFKQIVVANNSFGLPKQSLRKKS